MAGSTRIPYCPRKWAYTRKGLRRWKHSKAYRRAGLMSQLSAQFDLVTLKLARFTGTVNLAVHRANEAVTAAFANAFAPTGEPRPITLETMRELYDQETADEAIRVLEEKTDG